MLLLQIPSERAAADWSSLIRLFLVAGAISAPLAVLVITIDGFLRPGYSPISQVVSDLGIGQYAWILNTTLVVFGLLCMLFALGFSQAMRPLIGKRRVTVSTSLLLLTGAGIANDGVFTEYNLADPHAALHDTLHTLGFFVAFSSLAIALLLIGLQLRKDRVWRGYGWYSLISSLVMVLLIVMFLLIIFPDASPVSRMQVAGLTERLLLVIACAWPAVTGYRLFTRLQAQQADEYAGACAARFDLSLLGRKPSTHCVTSGLHGVAVAQHPHTPARPSQGLAAPVKANSSLSRVAA
jgi:hypothetical membrane protein